uniref:Uncharacterized protein n=1 Tax=Trichogramma kaykai TaxID=54128 RepID=A0ABD2WTY0_9HYME
MEKFSPTRKEISEQPSIEVEARKKRESLCEDPRAQRSINLIPATMAVADFERKAKITKLALPCTRGTLIVMCRGENHIDLRYLTARVYPA